MPCAAADIRTEMLRNVTETVQLIDHYPGPGEGSAIRDSGLDIIRGGEWVLQIRFGAKMTWM